MAGVFDTSLVRPLPPTSVPGDEVVVLAAIIPCCPPAYSVFNTRPMSEALTTIAAAPTMGQPVLFVSVPQTLRGGAGPARANFGTRRPESLEGGSMI